jgi:hypothetical protein
METLVRCSTLILQMTSPIFLIPLCLEIHTQYIQSLIVCAVYVNATGCLNILVLKLIYLSYNSVADFAVQKKVTFLQLVSIKYRIIIQYCEGFKTEIIGFNKIYILFYT